MLPDQTDYDGAWKEALEIYLEPFLRLCFPKVAEQIDWGVEIEFLDKELQEVVRDSDLGKQRVDKLIKVQRLDGEQEWVLLHMEVQSQSDPGLPERVYQYHHRLVDRFGRRCATLVILADESESWRPCRYETDLWGCRILFEFPACKLLELARQTDLETNPNPAAIVIAAHLAAQRTRDAVETRLEWKWRLTRRLYEMGLKKQDILELFRLIDWLITLPAEKEVEFRDKLHEYGEQNAMPHITSIERLSRQEGRQEGRQEALLEVLSVRFGKVPEGLQEAIEVITGEARLRTLLHAALRAPTLEDFTRSL